MFINLLFGHLFGDFIFQNKWMALGKSDKNFSGNLRCLVHCLIYTVCIILFTQKFNLYWTLLVFISHWPIDRYSLADKWLNFIGGRSLKDYYEYGHHGLLYTNINRGVCLEETHYNDCNHWVLRGSFSALVYCVVDNTMHLSIMWYGYKLLNSYGLL